MVVSARGLPAWSAPVALPAVVWPTWIVEVFSVTVSVVRTFGFVFSQESEKTVEAKSAAALTARRVGRCMGDRVGRGGAGCPILSPGSIARYSTRILRLDHPRH